MQQATPDPAESTAPSRRARWLFALVLLLGVALTLLFALRATRSFRHYQENRTRPPHEQVETIAPWMTVPYVAAAYRVPPEFIFEQLGLDAQTNARKPLRAIERDAFGGERGVVLQRVREAVQLYYAGGPVPAPVLPDPGSLPLPEGPPLDRHQPEDSQRPATGNRARP
jgi:hypothetical protein